MDKSIALLYESTLEIPKHKPKNQSEEFIINKLKNQKHSWLFKDAEDAINNYLARKPLHQNLDFPFTYTFDTSKSNLNEQITEAGEKIGKLIK